MCDFCECTDIKGAGSAYDYWDDFDLGFRAQGLGFVCVLLSIEYLHSMMCISLLPRYAGSGMSWPLELDVYPMVLIRSGMWWVGQCYGGRIYYGMVCGWLVVFGLSFWWPSSSGWKICGSYDAVSFVISGLSAVKSLIGVLPRSTPIIGHLPPFVVCKSL